MVEYKIIECLRKTAPHYHRVAEGIVNKTFSLCTCKRCLFRTGKTCIELANILTRLGLPIGYARVDMNGTCDRGKIRPETIENFNLEQQKVGEK